MFCVKKLVFQTSSLRELSNLPKLSLGLISRGFCTHSNSAETSPQRLSPSEGSEGKTEFRKVNIKSISNCRVDDKIRVQGWVKGMRKLKDHVFLEVNDGLSSHRLQVVLPANKKPLDLSMHTSIDVSGILFPSPKNPKSLELHPTSDIKILGPCDQKEYPFGGKVRYTPDYIRQHIHLRPKTNKFSSMFRLRNSMSKAIHNFFDENDFIQVHTPIFTSNDCEGAGETFTIIPGNDDLIKQMTKENIATSKGASTFKSSEVFFDKKVHLTVSGQLHLESAVSGLGKVWSFSPVFRAENQQSTRHLSEFYMVEGEVAFAYQMENILEVIEGLVKFCIERLLSNNIEDWGVVSNKDEKLKTLLELILSQPFTVMSFEEAKNLLKSKAGSVVQENKGLSREQELTLVEQLNNGIPVFVIDWPKSIKPFYMRECDYDTSKVYAVDLLVPSVGELCGGSLREADLRKLESRLNVLDPTGSLHNSLSWYLDLRRFGGVPTGGFGLGFDRLMQLITGQGNIKDVSPFPRWAHSCHM